MTSGVPSEKFEECETAVEEVVEGGEFGGDGGCCDEDGGWCSSMSMDLMMNLWQHRTCVSGSGCLRSSAFFEPFLLQKGYILCAFLFRNTFSICIFYRIVGSINPSCISHRRGI